MSEQQDARRRETLSCLGMLELCCWLHGVENTTPEKLAAIFSEKAARVRHYAMKLFDDVEDGEAKINSMWVYDTYEEIDKEEYSHEDE